MLRPEPVHRASGGGGEQPSGARHPAVGVAGGVVGACSGETGTTSDRIASTYQHATIRAKQGHYLRRTNHTACVIGVASGNGFKIRSESRIRSAAGIAKASMGSGIAIASINTSLTELVPLIATTTDRSPWS